MSARKEHRRQYRNIALKELLAYMVRFSAPAWVSLFHRVSGALLFLLLPLIIWAFDASLSSEISYLGLLGVLEHGFGFVPGWLLKLVILAILWAFLHHLIAGIRFLVLDVIHHLAERERSARSARWVLVLSVVLTVVLGAKVFGLY